MGAQSPTVFEVFWLTGRPKRGPLLEGIPGEVVVVWDMDRWGGGDHGEPPACVLSGWVQAGPALHRAPWGDRKIILRVRG